MRKPRVASDRPNVRCAIYTRKSTEEGLEKEFNSLDAQREAAEAYIKSQAHDGWVCLPQRYDDGGFTGGNMDRPALTRLLEDIEAGRVDAVVTYKVDRLSRSLLDFARMMQVFEDHHVSFVSVTQQFNTATSMGRLVLNVLLSFAQFEREIISERTRDKIAAARRKGKWVGGHPLLGYDVDPRSHALLVNEAEASRVREIFELYRERGGLISVVQELAQRGWLTKRWQGRKGQTLGGQPFTKAHLRKLLSNPAYVGKVRYKDEVHPGEQAAIVDLEVWQRVQDLLKEHGQAQRGVTRRASAALLKGLLHCRACGSRMTPTHAKRRGGKRYRYYACAKVIRHGRQACPTPTIPAPAIEQFVWKQLQDLATTANADDGIRAAFETSVAPEADPALVQCLVQRVDYDSRDGKVVIALHPHPDMTPAKPEPQEKRPWQRQRD